MVEVKIENHGFEVYDYSVGIITEVTIDGVTREVEIRVNTKDFTRADFEGVYVGNGVIISDAY